MYKMNELYRIIYVCINNFILLYKYVLFNLYEFIWINDEEYIFFFLFKCLINCVIKVILKYIIVKKN